ncbi:tripartite-type tricarboxylate transporter receptor subunit TctC [Azospirillum lipoferum]|uniref:Tripartite tricarboxylate transporter substrate binding protein n=1 Tax=Azospirillum lipoferum TaxID=193 RepID=A0A5A9GMN5_AZOLI|nr:MULTISPECIES: tripartite tricarboxylate transporter substrate binding protein [Azospirillum]KAA0594854.1 tripartite tricarboxylate transporter substrate binding protein [Azospirillum lipoferum]MCP1612818.1 tripartite-type tricarboxylate transporter receptor subunit TctC [Azospirillum lipoferum]MDW5532043.1 tripartite tricarboxylate transporter substrate binding protein [Azospirillum sp. NL1]
MPHNQNPGQNHGQNLGVEPPATGTARAAHGSWFPWLRTLTAATLLAVVPAIAPVLPASAAYPDKVVTIVVPFAPGGGTDTVTRILAEQMSKDLGQPVIVDNRPGAGTIIGTNIVANSAPDGYMLLMASFAHAVNPFLNAKLPFDTEKAFAPVGLVAKSYNIAVVNTSSQFKTLSDLIAYAKAHPGELNFGSFGNGTSAHLSAELFNHLAGTRIVHVPYKGAAPAVTDLLAGQVQVVFSSVASVSGHIGSGSLRPLAVTSAQRSKAFPDLPTVAESGVPGYVSDAWYGVYAPAGTPAAVIDRLNASLNKAIQSDAFKKLETVEGLVITPGTPQDFAAYVHGEAARWRDVVKSQNIKLN